MGRPTGWIGAGRGSDLLLIATAVLVVFGYVAWLQGATAGADDLAGEVAVAAASTGPR